MNRLVLHHLYATMAFDLSNNRNHGAPIDVSIASGVNSHDGINQLQPEASGVYTFEGFLRERRPTRLLDLR